MLPGAASFERKKRVPVTGRRSNWRETPVVMVNRRSSRSKTKPFRGLTGDRREPYLVWCGGLLCVVLAILALAGIASSNGWLPIGRSLPAHAATQAAGPAQVGDRADCAEIGLSDLRSPPEGLWFQSNCVAVPVAPLAANVTSCNRTSLNPAEFAPIAPGLYVTRGTAASQTFLWYASSDSCYDLVSARSVTAVCTDQTITFNWSTNVCAAHGGILAWVNGR